MTHHECTHIKLFFLAPSNYCELDLYSVVTVIYLAEDSASSA